MYSMSFSTSKILSSIFLRSPLRRKFETFVLSTSESSCYCNKLLPSYSTSAKFGSSKSSERKIDDKSVSQFQNFIPTKDLQVKDGHDPDVFGSLSTDNETKFDFADEIPDEEGDVEVKEIYKRKRLTTNQYAKIIKKFLAKKKLGNAISVLETRMLKEDKVEPELYIYNLLISACGDFGYTRKAFQLFNQLKKRGLKPSSSTYTSLFNACANSPWPEDGLKRIDGLRELLLEKGYVLNHLNYHAMIKAYGRCGNIEKAFKVVDEMMDNEINLSIETFTFLLQACVSDKEAGFRHSLLVWRKMLAKRIKPNLFAFNTMLRCTRDCGIGNIETTKDVIKTILSMTPEMKHQIMAPKTEENSQLNHDNISSLHERSENMNSNELIYNSQVEDQLVDGSYETSNNFPNLVARYPHIGDMIGIEEIVKPEHRLILVGGCDGFLKQMDANGAKPDIKTFTLMLDTIPPTITSEQALLKAMADRKVMPDIDFFNMLIKKRSMRRDYKNAKAVLKNIKQHSLSPDIVTFGVLSLACTSLEEAKELRASMDEVGYGLNVEILGALLKQACVQWDCDYVLYVLQALVEEGITPSPEFMETVKRFHDSVNNFIKNERVISRKGGNEQIANYLEKVRDEDFLNSFNYFSKYYNRFRVKVLVEVPHHPYKQFKKHDDPEDIELLNTGRS